MKVLAAKVIHLLLGTLLGYMVFVQLNDPDPAYWVGVYGVSACVPLARLFGLFLPWIGTVAFGMILAGLLISGPGMILYIESGDYSAIFAEMSSNRSYIEYAREFLGLCIALIIVASYGLYGFLRRR